MVVIDVEAVRADVSRSGNATDGATSALCFEKGVVLVQREPVLVPKVALEADLGIVRTLLGDVRSVPPQTRGACWLFDVVVGHVAGRRAGASVGISLC